MISTKSFLAEAFIVILILFRQYLLEIPLQIYLTIILISFIVAYVKDGFTPKCLTYILCTIFIAIGEITIISAFQYVAIILTVITYFFPSHLRKYPLRKQLVGLNEDIIANEYYGCELYPIDTQKQYTTFTKPWATQLQMEVMASRSNSKIARILLKIFISFLTKQKITFAQGVHKPTQNIILYSIGRGSTPTIYSLFLQSLAQQWKIFTIKHKQISKPQIYQPQALKAFRQKEVQDRANQLYLLFSQKKLQNKKITLMGHSYGCATIIQFYHIMSQKGLANNFEKIILQDPWFYPLTTETMNKKIKIPVYMIVHQFFAEDLDIYNRDKQFQKIHKPISIWIKNSTHVDITDVPVLLGNYFRSQNQFVPKRGFINQFAQSDRLRNVVIEIVKLCLKNASLAEIKASHSIDMLDEKFIPAKKGNFLSK